MTTTRRGFFNTAIGVSTLALMAPGRLWAQSSAETPQDNVSMPYGDAPGVYLNYNEFPEGPCPAALAAMVKAVPYSGRYGHRLADALQEALAKQLGVPRDWILLSSGSRALLKLTPHAFAEKGHTLTVAEPGSEEFIHASSATQWPIRRVPLLDNGAHDLDRMLSEPADVIYICNPNNPTGTITPHAALEQAMRKVPATTTVIVDEAYIHFSNQPSMAPLIAQYPNLVVMRSFSQLYGMAGSRCGFAVARPEKLARYTQYTGEPELSVVTTSGCLASVQQPRLVPERKQLNAQRRDDTIRWLKQHGFTCTPSEASFFMVDVKRPSQEVVDALARQKVFISNRWKMLPTTVRVTVGTADEMATFRKVFADVMGLSAASPTA